MSLSYALRYPVQVSVRCAPRDRGGSSGFCRTNRRTDAPALEPPNPLPREVATSVRVPLCRQVSQRCTDARNAEAFREKSHAFYAAARARSLGRRSLEAPATRMACWSMGLQAELLCFRKRATWAAALRARTRGAPEGDLRVPILGRAASTPCRHLEDVSRTKRFRRNDVTGVTPLASRQPRPHSKCLPAKGNTLLANQGAWNLLVSRRELGVAPAAPPPTSSPRTAFAACSRRDPRLLSFPNGRLAWMREADGREVGRRVAPRTCAGTTGSDQAPKRPLRSKRLAS